MVRADGQEDAAPDDQEAEGFGHSRHRILIELGVLLCLVVALPVGAVYAAGRLAGALLPWVPISVDETLGKQASDALVLGHETCDDAALQQYIEALAAPLVASANGEFEFRFRIVADEAVNAFALPGGYVTVNLGLLSEAASSEEVAAVLAHELEHVLQRHSTARLLTSLGGSAVLGILLGGTDLGVPAGLVRDVMEGSYSRAQEAEADRLGIQLLERAGIDPSGMATLFERLAQSTASVPQILSSHPDPGDRAKLARQAAQGRTFTRVLPRLPPSSCH